MNSEKFSQNDRVKISENCFWAKGVSGTVTSPPIQVQEIAGNWNGVWRVLDTPRGAETSYWVHFDARQFDGDGDGPFFGAEFEQEYLVADSGALPQLEEILAQDIEAVWYENKRLGLRVEFKAFVKREVPKESALHG